MNENHVLLGLEMIGMLKTLSQMLKSYTVLKTIYLKNLDCLDLVLPWQYQHLA
jgi:hypothetical protein